MQAKHITLLNVFFYVLNLPFVESIFSKLTCAMAKRVRPRLWHTISIEPYNVCNLKCIMCPYKKMKRKKEQMNMELYRKIVHDAAESGIRDLNLSFYNEPLLDDLLFDRISYAKSRGMHVRFFSNGTLLTENKVSQILDVNVDKIIFSFDGATKENYEKIRVGANFEETRANIVQLIKERNRRNLKTPSISIGMAIQKDNQSDVKHFINFWKNLADEGSTWNVVDTEKIGLLPKKFEIKLRRPYPCVPLIYDELIVMSNGKVPLCCMDYDGSIILGDLNNQTIKEIRQSNPYKKIEELHLRGKADLIKLCRECDHLYLSGYDWYLRAFPKMASAYYFTKNFLAKF